MNTQEEMSDELPQYSQEQFAAPPADCDMIMKGGVTSGIVYPFAVLEVATCYRLRSIGGTSAGAIAAAFAAAAEYARRNADPGGFVRLQKYCDELPAVLPTLFQPDSEIRPTVERIRRAAEGGGLRAILPRLAIHGLLAALMAGGLVCYLAQGWMTVVLAALLAGLLSILVSAYLSYVGPLLKAFKGLPGKGFGICSGLGTPGGESPALTEWMHRALQDIAFGDPNRERPLTFGDLEKHPEGTQPISQRRDYQHLDAAAAHLAATGCGFGF